MKIGFCGTFGVGKTTILKESEIFFKTHNYIISTERVLAKEKNFDFNKATIDEKIIFQKELIHHQIKKEKENINFVTDTSLVDILAYSYFIQDINSALFEKEFTKTIKNYFDEYGRYDILFYIPIEFEIHNDGVRHIDNDFRHHIDEIIKKHLDLFGKKIITLSGDRERRKEILKNSL